ncbi:MAG TPA: efflux RND transporter periplasmic adaptor subunit [Alphaproteobacteria bacterium]
MLSGFGDRGFPETRPPRAVPGSRIFGLLALLSVVACDQATSQPQASEPPPPPSVSVAKPIVKEIVETDEFTGRFEAAAAVEVRARVTGYLASVHFREGSIVKEGDLLFVIDRRPYQALLDQAEAAVASAQARVEFARQELDRVERLTRTGAAPERTLDERRQQIQAAQADLAGAQAVAQQTRLDLEFTEIHAPITGRIGRKLVNEGNLVRPNETLLTTIVALDPIHFYFDIDERSYLAYSRTGLNVARPSGQETGHDVLIALADEREPRHPGRVDFVDNRIDQATGTMRGRAVVENKDLFLTPGMFGRIVVPGSNFYRAVLVPDEAIGTDLDRRFVYVVDDDGTVSQKVIRPGPRHDGYRIVREGLTGDETLIVNGLQRVRLGGGRVTPQLTELPPSREPVP